MSDMHLVYVPASDHILAVHQHVGGPPPTPDSLAGEAGLLVSGVRTAHAATQQTLNFGTPTTEKEQFWIPARELAVRTLPLEPDVLARPCNYVVDATQVAFLPLPTIRLRIGIDAAGTKVVVTTPAINGHISFPTQRRVWIQVEGPNPVDRRLIASVLPAGHNSPFDFPLTVDTDGPIAAVPVGGHTYHLLVLIEGLVPDVRTQVL
jgi:hypothetical protein